MLFVDLFCGAGGFSSGFEQAGFECVMALDIDKWSCLTHKYNFPKAEILQEDIRSVDFKRYNYVDVVIGSPPCKEFSVGNIDRNFDDILINEFFRAIEEIRPRYWVMENVPDVQRVLGKHAGFTIILKASEFNCATTRERLFASNIDLTRVENFKCFGKVIKDVVDINAPGFKQFYKEEVYRKINPDKPFVTLVEQRICNERYLLPSGRSLDISEMAKIQGFPDKFIFIGSRSEAQKMIGKSVCPPIAKAIAETIKVNINEPN